MLTVDFNKSIGNDRLALVAAHPPKIGEGRAPAFVVGLVRAKLGWATRRLYIVKDSKLIR
jgi:hypothetical protein